MCARVCVYVHRLFANTLNNINIKNNNNKLFPENRITSDLVFVYELSWLFDSTFTSKYLHFVRCFRFYHVVVLFESWTTWIFLYIYLYLIEQSERGWIQIGYDSLVSNDENKTMDEGKKLYLKARTTHIYICTHIQTQLVPMSSFYFDSVEWCHFN